MNRIAFIVAGVAASVVALVSGCASTQSVAASDDGIDYAKVAAINNAARARGVEVHWVTFPQRRATPTNVVPTPGAPTGT